MSSQDECAEYASKVAKMMFNNSGRVVCEARGVTFHRAAMILVNKEPIERKLFMIVEVSESVNADQNTLRMNVDFVKSVISKVKGHIDFEVGISASR